jgi:DNA-binding response OmpR family regulator
MAVVLVIEDEDALRTSLEKVLLAHGYQVVLARNGREGIRLAQRATYDLVVTDLIMPEMEGIETIRELRRTVGGVPIIAISGGGTGRNSFYLKLARDLGATVGLAKPFNSRQLLDAMDHVLNGHAPPGDVGP